MISYAEMISPRAVGPAELSVLRSLGSENFITSERSRITSAKLLAPFNNLSKEELLTLHSLLHTVLAHEEKEVPPFKTPEKDEWTQVSPPKKTVATSPIITNSSASSQTQDVRKRRAKRLRTDAGMLILGTSMYRYLQAPALLKKDTVAVHSYPGATIEEMTETIKEYTPSDNIKKILVTVGRNDVMQQKTEYTILFKNLINALKHIFRSAVIFVGEVAPFPDDSTLNKKIQELNFLIHQNAKILGYTVFHNFQSFYLGNNINRKLFAQDGIHFSRRGYSTLARKIKEFFDEIPPRTQRYFSTAPPRFNRHAATFTSPTFKHTQRQSFLPPHQFNGPNQRAPQHFHKTYASALSSPPPNFFTLAEIHKLRSFLTFNNVL